MKLTKRGNNQSKLRYKWDKLLIHVLHQIHFEEGNVAYSEKKSKLLQFKKTCILKFKSK